MKHLFLFIFLCVSVISFAQPTEGLTPNSESLIDVNYVYLNTRSIIKAEYVLYESKIFKKDHFLVDGERYELGQVKFYQNEDVFLQASTKVFKRVLLKKRQQVKSIFLN
jgi:hypothetical protein